MAMHRMFNSTTPFKELKGGSVLEYPYPGEEGSSEGMGGKQDLGLGKILPSLSVLLTHGSAKQVGAGDQETKEPFCVSIIRQAECKWVGGRNGMNWREEEGTLNGEGDN